MIWSIFDQFARPNASICECCVEIPLTSPTRITSRVAGSRVSLEPLNVAGIDPVEVTQFGREVLDLLGRREDARWVEQSRGKAPGALLEGLAELLMSSATLVVPELAPLEPDLVDPQRTMRDHRNDVEHGSPGIEEREVVGERRPRIRQVGGAQERGVALERRAGRWIDRCRRVAAIAGHEGRDALRRERRRGSRRGRGRRRRSRCASGCR